MNDPDETLSKASSNHLVRLEKARSGFWLFGWIGLGLAAFWWTFASISVSALAGPRILANTDPMIIIMGLIGIILPGFILVMLGLLAREQARSGAANAIILEAASNLLNPAQAMVEQTETLAGQMIAASKEINHVSEQAVSAMQAMSDEIGRERARLESVTYASADNARELTRRLAHERNGLEQLSKDLNDQADVINQAIPHQAALMVDSAKTAAGEVARAEEALQARLAVLNKTASALHDRVASMDSVADKTRQRNENLFRAISHMDDKLEHVRETIEATARAGELAVSAANTTGSRLTESVKAALDSAEQTSATIHNQTLDTAESVARILADLKETGQEVTAAIRAAGVAAETGGEFGAFADTERFERPASGHTESLTGAYSGQETREYEYQSDPSVPSPIEQYIAARSPDPGPPGSDTIMSRSEQTAIQQDPALTAADGGDNGASSLAAMPEEPGGGSSRPGGGDTDSGENGVITGNTPENGETNSLSTIIADMEREEHHALPREETAEKVLARLEDSGIRLNDIFRYRHKKKIAAATRKGHAVRRDVISRQAGRQVERVRKRLQANPELATLARDFITLERADALNALADTAHLKRNASARLTGYLLLDTAMNTVNQA